MAPQVVFSTPRKLPHPSEAPGRVAVLDIAFAGQGRSTGFDKVTLPFIQALGPRLRAWVDHHDHDEHVRFANDPRFVLATKAEHGACPEMIDPGLVERIGPVDTIVCHTDFDGLASAAKWMRGGVEPYPGCDDDARAIDTRLGQPSRTAERLDQALRARPRDMGLFGLVVRHLAAGLVDAALWQPIDAAGAEWRAIETETRRLAKRYQRLPAGVAFLEVDKTDGRFDKTLLLLLGQEREPVSVVAERDTVSVAARFDSGLNFVKLLGLAGGMPTRVAVPRSRLAELLSALGVEGAALDYR
ncbi:MAG: hypothetical protein ABI895_10435 [Deltaproteobacteria bacterium]